MTDLLLVVLCLFGVWALACIAGMAVLCLPFLLFYAAYGLFLCATYVGLAVFAGLGWLRERVSNFIRLAMASMRRVSTIRREREWTTARQREAKREIDTIFAKASADMERLRG